MSAINFRKSGMSKLLAVSATLTASALLWGCGNNQTKPTAPGVNGGTKVSSTTAPGSVSGSVTSTQGKQTPGASGGDPYGIMSFNYVNSPISLTWTVPPSAVQQNMSYQAVFCDPSGVTCALYFEVDCVQNSQCSLSPGQDDGGSDYTGMTLNIQRNTDGSILFTFAQDEYTSLMGSTPEDLWVRAFNTSKTGTWLQGTVSGSSATSTSGTGN